MRPLEPASSPKHGIRADASAHGLRRPLTDWGLRAVFGCLLAGSALAALAAGGLWFALFIAAVTMAGAREWHRLAGGGSTSLSVTIAAIILPLAFAVFMEGVSSGPYLVGIAIISSSCLSIAALAAAQGKPVFWAAAGPLYLALPALSLFALRAAPAHGAWLTLMLFAGVWGCDTGAMITGKLIGGPKFLPELSPNKTWSGYGGGLCLGAAAAAAVAACLGNDVWRAALFGFIIALIGHVGDMFESWVKRRFGQKDSGTLIPGHGGALDRIDSILFAAPACAAYVFAFGAQGIFGGPL